MSRSMRIVFVRRVRGGGPSRGEGFTLIELMVALMLAAIISMSIMMISSQARSAYDETVKKVDVYSRFRYALQQLELDLMNWNPTGELEFFEDGGGRGGKLNNHWDPGEEARDDRDQRWGTGVRDGGQLKKYDEFAFIEQRHYKSRELGKTEVKKHDAYRLYFQTVTYIDGAMQLANVEYYLSDPNTTLSSSNKVYGFPTEVAPEGVAQLMLLKVVRYYEISPDSILKLTELPVKREVVEIATNVTDFKVEYSVEPRLVTRASRRASPVQYYTPEMEYRKPVEVASRPKGIDRQGRVVTSTTPERFMKVFGYGSMDLNQRFPRATAYPDMRGDRNVGFNQGRHEPARVGFSGSPDMQFAQLVPGDRIFIFTEGNTGARAAGQAAGAGGGSAQLVRFPSGDYTIKANMSGLLELREDVDSTEWNGQQQPGVFYKAAFMPASFRVTLRVVDDRGQNPKTLQKVIWTRRRSR